MIKWINLPQVEWLHGRREAQYISLHDLISLLQHSSVLKIGWSFHSFCSFQLKSTFTCQSCLCDHNGSFCTVWIWGQTLTIGFRWNQMDPIRRLDLAILGLNLRHWCRLQDPLDIIWPVAGGSTFKNQTIKTFANQQWSCPSHLTMVTGVSTLASALVHPPELNHITLLHFFMWSLLTLLEMFTHPPASNYHFNFKHLSLFVYCSDVCIWIRLFVQPHSGAWHLYLHTPPLRQGTTHLLNSHRAP